MYRILAFMEKGLEILADTAKEFVQNIISPPLIEVGGLFADKVRIYRLKNQISTVVKGEEALKKSGLKGKKINLKILAPLLEECSLEEDEDLQTMWGNLLANSVREDSTITNALFVHILSQLSKEEAEMFEAFTLRSSLESNGNTKYHKILNDVNRIENMKTHRRMLDNLYRLRLLREQTGVVTYDGGTTIVISDLGYAFYEACQPPK